MAIFRTYLVIVIAVLGLYTLMVGAEHGWNLIPLFFWQHPGHRLARPVQYGFHELSCLVCNLGQLAAPVFTRRFAAGCCCIFRWHDVSCSLSDLGKPEGERGCQRFALGRAARKLSAWHDTTQKFFGSCNLFG